MTLPCPKPAVLAVQKGRSRRTPGRKRSKTVSPRPLVKPTVSGREFREVLHFTAVQSGEDLSARKTRILLIIDVFYVGEFTFQANHDASRPDRKIPTWKLG